MLTRIPTGLPFPEVRTAPLAERIDVTAYPVGALPAGGKLTDPTE